MSKQIRLEDEVYGKLEAIRDKRETFSEAVARLIKIHDGLGLLTSTIQGQKSLKDFQLERLHGVKRSQEVIGTDMSGDPLIKRPRGE